MSGFSSFKKYFKNIFKKVLTKYKCIVSLSHNHTQHSHLTHNVMSKAAIKINHQGMATLQFFNSTEIYSVKMFDTERKARNYAKKFGILICDIPSGMFYMTCN